MKRDDIAIAILRIEGTNCEAESYAAFAALGVRPDYVHLNALRDGHVSVHDYHGIFIPGGFSSGDYVRAGAIFAARIKALVMEDLMDFVAAGYPLVGVCNGFQVLTELGMLPALDGISPVPYSRSLTPYGLLNYGVGGGVLFPCFARICATAAARA